MTFKDRLEKELGFNIDADGTIRASFAKNQNFITPHGAVLKLEAKCIELMDEIEGLKQSRQN